MASDKRTLVARCGNRTLKSNRMPPVASHIYDVFTSWVAGNRATLLKFAKTGYSFEEWVNWGLFDALQNDPASCDPKPRYEDGSGYADLKISLGGQCAFVEIGIVHDDTLAKWKEKLEGDRKKLLRVKDETIGVQLILVVTNEPQSIAKQRCRWLTQLSFWSAPDIVMRKTAIKTDPHIIVRGWLVQKPSC